MTSYRRRTIAVTLWGIMSFTQQLISVYWGNMLPYLIITAAALLFLVFADNRIALHFSSLPTELLWVVNLLIILIGILRGGFTPAARNDIITYTAGVLFLMFSGTDETVFVGLGRVVRFFSLFFACSVWLQMLAPPVYNAVFFNHLSPTHQLAVLGIREGGSFTGFSTNSGFTAGHINAGILLLMSKILMRVGKTRRNIIELLFLALSLLMTGKRGLLLAVTVSGVLMYLISARGRQRFTRFYRALIVFVVMVLLFFLFADMLAFIPVISRTMDSVRNFMEGGDISSGRNRIYEYALELIAEHPVNGIGWGQFRATSQGNALFTKDVDAHNIYLQLLCELGLVGFVPIAGAFALYLFLTARMVSVMRIRDGISRRWKQLLLFSMGYQIFFLIYGLSGNPFFDQNFVILYMLSCAVTSVSLRRFHSQPGGHPKKVSSTEQADSAGTAAPAVGRRKRKEKQKP